MKSFFIIYISFDNILEKGGADHSGRTGTPPELAELVRGIMLTPGIA
jgi:hypothetical protein